MVKVFSSLNPFPKAESAGSKTCVSLFYKNRFQRKFSFIFEAARSFFFLILKKVLFEVKWTDTLHLITCFEEKLSRFFKKITLKSGTNLSKSSALWVHYLKLRHPDLTPLFHYEKIMFKIIGLKFEVALIFSEIFTISTALWIRNITPLR